MTILKTDTVSGIGTEGTVFEGDITFDSLNYMTLPKGTTTQSSRGRGIVGGGSPGTDNNEQIEYMNIQSTGNAIDFGELIQARRGNGGCSSSTRGVFASGTAGNPSPAFSNSMEYIEIAVTSNAVTFGDLNYATRNLGGVSSGTRGLFAGGGDNPALVDTIDYITFASIGNATDFGNLLAAIKGATGVGSPTRALFGGGITPSASNVIQYVTIATTGNATDFGDLTTARYFCGGVSSTTRGVWGGGIVSDDTNTIDYVTIASTGNATDFGDLLDERSPDNSQICSHIRGLFVGGENPGPAACNIIAYVTIASTGNAKDFGDLITTTSQSGGCSDSHGGLTE
jgi:hypothetical protein